jgi:hypothetical protein
VLGCHREGFHFQVRDRFILFYYIIFEFYFSAIGHSSWNVPHRSSFAMISYNTLQGEISAFIPPPTGALCITDLPNELLLEIISYLPLKGLIATRGVSRMWRDFVSLSCILPVRRALLDLYYEVIQAPDFLSSRENVISSLLPFDREVYVAAIEEQINGDLPAGMCRQRSKPN